MAMMSDVGGSPDPQSVYIYNVTVEDHHVQELNAPEICSPPKRNGQKVPDVDLIEIQNWLNPESNQKYSTSPSKCCAPQIGDIPDG